METNNWVTLWSIYLSINKLRDFWFVSRYMIETTKKGKRKRKKVYVMV